MRLHAIEATVYDRNHLETFNPLEQRRLWSTMRSLARHDEAALDIGSGTGNLSIKLAAAGLRVVASDISKEMLKVQQAKVVPGNLCCVVAESAHLPFRDGAFHLVTMNSVVHHLPDWQATFREVLRCLNSNAAVYIDHESAFVTNHGWRWHVTRAFNRAARMWDGVLWRLLPALPGHELFRSQMFPYAYMYAHINCELTDGNPVDQAGMISILARDGYRVTRHYYFCYPSPFDSLVFRFLNLLARTLRIHSYALLAVRRRSSFIAPE